MVDVSRYRVPPGITLFAIDAGWGEALVHCNVDTVDVNTGGRVEFVFSMTVDSQLPQIVIDARIVAFVADVWMHELHEWLAVDGVRVKEPFHAPR